MREVLTSLLSTSPYLSGLALVEADWLNAALSLSAGDAYANLLEEVEAAHLHEPDETASLLRQAKARMALLAGLAELGTAWTTEQATKAMSGFADAALKSALGSLMVEAEKAGRIKLPELCHPAEHCGLALFALGKLGGEELNYSSDIDIVAFFDQAAVELAEPDEADKFYMRIVQKLVSMMDTGPNMVFRTDLAPEARSGFDAGGDFSTNAAMQYYESRGQNWERAAWIKARVAAGDAQVGAAFLAELSPFIWRKHLDYVTIADVQAMKRQINISPGRSATRRWPATTSSSDAAVSARSSSSPRPSN